MRKLKIAYLLAFAPLLMGADQYASNVEALIVNSLPQCADSEYLTYTANGLGCTTIQGGSISVPDCKTSGQLLTYTMSGEIGVFSCTAKGSESLSATDITTINTKFTDLTNLNTQIINIEKNPSAPAAKYCGQSPQQVQNGAALSDGGADGIPAASSICSKVATCGTGARMCSVYDMYNSVATGVINNGADVPKSWVYQASWSQEFADPSQSQGGSGQSDNCGGFTYPTADRKWYGTAVEWKVSGTGKKALLFHSGPGSLFVPTGTTGTINTAVTNTFAVPCSSKLPIACCK